MAFDISTARPVGNSAQPQSKGRFDISTARPVEATPTPAPVGQEQGKPGFWDRTKKAFTGEDLQTPEMGSLQEIGGAPELNRRSVPAFKASLGLLATGDDKSLRGILREQLGEEVSFREDGKGNTIVDLPSGSYALNKPGMSAQDVVRGLFDFLSYTPAGKAATIPAAAVRSAATEGILQGTEQTLGGQNVRPGEVALAGGIGGAFKGVESAAGAGYRALKGNPGSGVVQAGDDAGIRILTSDIYQPDTFVSKTAQQTGEKIPLAGTGAIREQQQQARERAVSSVAEKYGEFSYGAIIESLKTQKNRVKNAAGSVLEGAGNKLNSLGEIPMSNTRQSAHNAMTELSRKGVLPSSGAMNDLAQLVETLAEAPQTFSTLKENRTAFTEIIKGADKAERSQLTSRAKSLLMQVSGAMKRDMDDFARQNLTPAEFSKWQKANATYAEEAQKLTRSRLKSVLDRGDVTPEAVETMLFSRKPSEVKNLYQSLTPAGRANARSAIISKVFNDLNRRQSGVTPNSFASEMKKYDEQVGIFFKGAERQQLRGLVKVLDATRRAQDAAVTTPTGQQLLGAGTLAAASTDLGATIGLGGTLGLLARVYESRPVRDALLRLDSLPPGSTAFEKAAAEAARLLNASAQTARRGMSDTESPPRGPQ